MLFRLLPGWRRDGLLNCPLVASNTCTVCVNACYSPFHKPLPEASSRPSFDHTASLFCQTTSPNCQIAYLSLTTLRKYHTGLDHEVTDLDGERGSCIMRLRDRRLEIKA